MKSAFQPVARVRCAAWGLLLAHLLSGCGGEGGVTPEDCPDVPEYDVRAADVREGAVMATGIVQDSPLSEKQQRYLQQLAAKGCITLPRQTFSLDAEGQSPNAGPAVDPTSHVNPVGTSRPVPKAL